MGWQEGTFSQKDGEDFKVGFGTCQNSLRTQALGTEPVAVISHRNLTCTGIART